MFSDILPVNKSSLSQDRTIASPDMDTLPPDIVNGLANNCGWLTDKMILSVSKGTLSGDKASPSAGRFHLPGDKMILSADKNILPVDLFSELRPAGERKSASDPPAVCLYDFMNASRSALIRSACVVGIPCGKPG